MGNQQVGLYNYLNNNNNNNNNNKNNNKNHGDCNSYNSYNYNYSNALQISACFRALNTWDYKPLMINPSMTLHFIRSFIFGNLLLNTNT